ncbi:MAG TPA: hypothetical protein EYQ84_04910 [Nitrospinaceae bacterium]|nr:hypothetical protein [Nitrospinaceae bacterium]HIL26941.1 hypothetical protein [Nitrospinaceae bacterium]
MIDATFKTIAKAVKKKNQFACLDFGTFIVWDRKARKGDNP